MTEARPVRVTRLVRATIAVAVGFATGGSAAAASNAFFGAAFNVASTPVTFGQAPSWTHDGHVLSSEVDQGGVYQVYVSRPDGSDLHCLTCGLPGPNRFALERPRKADWILFCSWRGKTFIGSPCFGGYGTDLYVMRPDGTQPTRLTDVDAAQFPQDNYHPAWSPDGTQLVWTHLDFHAIADGGTQYTILLADFVDDASGPHVANVRAVGPAYDAGIETQEWAPDGSGVLFTLWGGKTLSGWMNGELYVMRLSGGGASPAHPVVTQLTDGNPAWDEQAVFTHDMKNVIWMSSRDHPTWYQTVVSAGQWLGFDAPQPATTFGPLFFQTIGDHRFQTELYMMDLSTHAVRRLTSDDSIVPEFHFDRTGKRLIWTETGSALTGGGIGPTRIGTFRRAPGHPLRTTSPEREPLPPPVVPAPRTTSVRAAAGVPPEVVAGVVLAVDAENQIAHRLAGLSAGGGCCAGSASAAFLAPRE
jgi:Tol biopolymer transport system component